MSKSNAGPLCLSLPGNLITYYIVVNCNGNLTNLYPYKAD